MGKHYQLENDHIFPYSRLKRDGYGKSNRLKYALAQEMTNRAILTQIANRGKASALARDYLANVKEHFPKALGLQCVPEDEKLWEIDRYEDFLTVRRKILSDALNTFLDNITTMAEVTEPVSLEDLIAQGETDTLEFKSSLRWDYKKGGVNKKLEEVAIKSVAALTNSDGGTLLIGVNDNGVIVGLENDYASLSADRDKFEVHLRNLLNQQFGLIFVKDKICVSFPNIGEDEICMIEVSPGDKPVVVKVRDASDQIVERFFVRSGNTSQEVPLNQLSSYWSARFPQS